MREATRHDYVGGKVSLDHVYDLPDPRPYFGALGALDYQEPEHGRRLFSALLGAMGRDRPKITDLCCSYGVIPALLKCGLSLDDLYARYLSGEMAGLSREELAAADREFYAGRRGPGSPEAAGVDVAGEAVRYALDAGLLDRGVVADLEEGPAPGLREAVAGTDLVTVTGGVGYVLGGSFDRLLSAMTEGGRRSPWVAALAVRFVRYETISSALARHGLVTEKLTGHTFPRRRFADRGERDWVLGNLRAEGVDPAGKEAEGWYHSELYLSRPVEEAGTPLQTLLAPALP